VAYGAAVQAGILMGSDESSEIILLDVNSLSLGVKTKGGLMSVIIPRKFLFLIVYSSNSGEQLRNLCSFLVPLFHLLILSTGYSNIPIETTKVYSTAKDNQDAVTVQVYEGERPVAQENHLLGKFDLAGIPPAARGAPHIEVTFNIDFNGILHVRTYSKSTLLSADLLYLQ